MILDYCEVSEQLPVYVKLLLSPELWRQIYPSCHFFFFFLFIMILSMVVLKIALALMWFQLRWKISGFSFQMHINAQV